MALLDHERIQKQAQGMIGGMKLTLLNASVKLGEPRVKAITLGEGATAVPLYFDNVASDDICAWRHNWAPSPFNKEHCFPTPH